MNKLVKLYVPGPGIYAQSGLPNNADGLVDGNFWLDIDTSVLYGPKYNGQYPTTGIAIGMVAGGTTGQVLAKNSNTNYDASFQTINADDINEGSAHLFYSDQKVANLLIGGSNIQLTYDPVAHTLALAVVGFGTAALNNTGDFVSSTTTVNGQVLTGNIIVTDQGVRAVNGIVKADGQGNVTAAIPGTDYLTGALLSNLVDQPLLAGDVILAQRPSSNTNGVAGEFAPTVNTLVSLIVAVLNPVNTVAPVISFDTTKRGYVTSNGTWNVPFTFTYQWYVNGNAIAGATTNFYNPTSVANGQLLTLKVSPYQFPNISATSNTLVADSDVDLYANMMLSFYNERYFDTIGFVFDKTLTPADFTNPLYGDRWTYWNDMYLSIGVPNGFVLGTLPLPAVAAGVTRTWSMTGDTQVVQGLTIDPVSGQITVLDTTKLTLAATMNAAVTASDKGTYNITIPLLAANQVIVAFIDATNGSDTNTGYLAHLPRKSYPSYNPSNKVVAFKRASTYTGTISSNGGGFIYKSFGDPSLGKARILPTPTGEDYVVRSPYKSGTSNFNGVATATFSDLIFDGNQLVEHPFNLYNAQDILVLRCDFTNNTNTANANGISCRFGSRWRVRHCNWYNCAGDNIYFTQTNNIEIAYCYEQPPTGGVADSIQITDEETEGQTCYNAWVHHTILSQDVNSNTVKGAVVIQGTNGYLMEDCFLFGKYFGAGIVGRFGTFRNNYVYQCLLPTTNGNYNNTWGIGPGDNEYSHNIHIYDNTVNNTAKGIIISGYGSVGTAGWNRGDMLINHNTIFNCFGNFMRVSESWSGYITNNISFANASNGTVYVAGNGANTANKTGPVTLSWNSATGVVTATSTGTLAPYLHNGDYIIISGATEPEYNGTFQIGGLSAYTSKVFNYTITGTPANPTASGSPIFTSYFVYNTRTIANNPAQSVKGPEWLVEPYITGICEEGQTVNCVITSQTSVKSVTYQWRLNGTNIVGATSASYTIPVGSAAIVDNFFRPNWVPSGYTRNLYAPELSCVVTASDNTNVSYTTAYWQTDGRLYEQINVQIVFNSTPSIIGSNLVGQTLTGSDGAATGGTGTLVTSRQWYGNGVAIVGATNNTYTTTMNDIGKVITYGNVVTDSAGATKSSISTGTSPITDSVANIPNGYFWMDPTSDPTANFTVSGTSVLSANDLFGSAKTVTQPTTARAPTLGQSGVTINGLTAFNFNGSRVLLASSLAGLGNGDYTVYAVVNSVTGNAATHRHVISDGAGLDLRIDPAQLSSSCNSPATYATSAVTIVSTDTHLIGCVKSGNTITNIFDGLLTDSAVAAADASPNIFIGGAADASAGDNLIARVGDFIIYQGAHDTTTVNRVLAMMKAKWGF